MFTLITVAVITTINWGSISISPAPKPQDLSAITVQNVIELTNDSRASHGLAPLKENAYLDAFATDRVSDEVTHDNFSHVDSHGLHSYQEVSTFIYPYKNFGENLAVNFDEVVTEQDAWDASPEHEENILNPVYQDVGVGIEQGYHDGELTTWVAVEFGNT